VKKSLLLAAVLVFGLVPVASASCTVSTTCSNACSIIDYICSSPFPPCDLLLRWEPGAFLHRHHMQRGQQLRDLRRSDHDLLNQQVLYWGLLHPVR